MNEILFSQEAIAERVQTLAREINCHYAQKLCVIVLSNGAMFFASDLLRLLEMPIELDSLAVSSYIGTESSGEICFRSELKVDISDKDVLIVDDIFESGQTIDAVFEYLRSHKARSVKTCVLLLKNCERKTAREPDFSGFTIKDEFVIGYGMDYNELYRNLPYIAIMRDRNGSSG
ncbi:MAG: hypoxanthine phosphoribosyltransferase [Lentisphaeria bacterium]|nr:hypoxanthine phosphoribosyltransferase [Lentisphaeria bacterium]NQZ68593.1 hypoxanthine phosphoribosyltransferase [Lentisphaeria bacterium]